MNFTKIFCIALIIFVIAAIAFFFSNNSAKQQEVDSEEETIEMIEADSKTSVMNLSEVMQSIRSDASFSEKEFEED